MILGDESDKYTSHYCSPTSYYKGLHFEQYNGNLNKEKKRVEINPSQIKLGDTTFLLMQIQQ